MSSSGQNPQCIRSTNTMICVSRRRVMTFLNVAMHLLTQCAGRIEFKTHLASIHHTHYDNPDVFQDKSLLHN